MRYGPVLNRVAEQKRVAYRDWEAASDATASDLIKLPFEERVARFQKWQSDLTQQAWDRVIRSVASDTSQTDKSVTQPKRDPEAAHYNGVPPRLGNHGARRGGGEAGAGNRLQHLVDANGHGTEPATPRIDPSANNSETGGQRRRVSGGNMHSRHAVERGQRTSMPRSKEDRTEQTPPEPKRRIAGHIYDTAIVVLTICAITAIVLWIIL